MIDFVFFVYIPGTTRREFTGGHVVLHKLVKIISDLGYEVWTNQSPIFNCNCNVANDLENLEAGKLDKVIVVYPEHIAGNPINVEKVCRWVLYHTSNEIEKSWSNSDVVYKYCYGFSTGKDNERLLSVIDSKLDIFKNEGLGDKRNGYCHINKKKYPKDEKILSSLNSTDLSDFTKKGGFEYLCSKFNEYEFFITYDDATYYSVLAALCGCRSIIINTDPSITPEEYRLNFPINKYGVAYGWQDLKHADLTRDLTRQYIDFLEKESIESVKRFIEFWEGEQQKAVLM